MVRKVALLTIGLLFSFSGYCCDSCGGAASGNTFGGLLSAYRYNYIGLSWQHASFGSAHANGHSSYDDFHFVEAKWSHHFTPKFKMVLRQPFRWNIRQNEDGRQELKGFSDTKVMGVYTIFNKLKLGKLGQLLLPYFSNKTFSKTQRSFLLQVFSMKKSIKIISPMATLKLILEEMDDLHHWE